MEVPTTKETLDNGDAGEESSRSHLGIMESGGWKTARNLQYHRTIVLQRYENVILGQLINDELGDELDDKSDDASDNEQDDEQEE